MMRNDHFKGGAHEAHDGLLRFGSPEYLSQVETGKHPPAMFATAPELFLTHKLSDLGENERKEDLMEEKRDEADSRAGLHPEDDEYGTVRGSQRQSGWYGGLSNRLRKYGYDWSKPLTVRNEPSSGLSLTDGHHRLAVMMRDRPNEFMPIEYR